MRYNQKSDKERKDAVVIVRLNQGERRRLELLSRKTGLSFSGLIRQQVLSLEEFTKYNPDYTWQTRFHRKYQAIARRTDIDDTEKLRQLGEMLVQWERRGLKVREQRATVRGRKSA